MQEWKKRVITEKNELSARIEKLKSFLNSEDSIYIEEEDRVLLRWQLSIMHQYLMVLGYRVDEF